VNHWNVQPDVVCSAKGIASGMPLSATIARKEIMSEWSPGAHASTFGGNPVSCAAAIATFDLLQNGLIENAARMGAYLEGKLCDIASRHPSIGDVRGRGLMMGVEFVRDRATRKRAPEIRDAVVNYAFENRLLMLGAGPNTIRVIPALTVEPEIIDEAMVIFERAIARAEEELL